MGLEGIVSKRLSAPYRSGRSRDWLKVKNPDSPAMIRARDAVMPRTAGCSNTGSSLRGNPQRRHIPSRTQGAAVRTARAGRQLQPRDKQVALETLLKPELLVAAG
jgi:hypothetical protein